MSVGFWMMKPEQVFIGGRDEANWLCRYMPYVEHVDSSSDVDVSPENIREAVRVAKRIESEKRPAGQNVVSVGSFDSDGIDLANHRRITREMPARLRGMLRMCKKETGHEWFTLSISW